MAFSVIAIGLGLALGGLVHWCGMRQFGGMDLGTLIDTGWRLAQGQRPYVDFPCTTPPAFFLGAGYAFKLFGVSWEAQVLFTSVVSVLIFFWSVWLGTKLFNDRGFVLLVGFTVQALSMLLHSFWWYNTITSAAAAVFLLSAALLWLRPESEPARMSYLVSLMFLALTKPNVAGVLILAISAIFLCSRQHRLLVLLLSTGAFAAFMAFLSLNRLSLLRMLQAYLSVAGHATETKNAMAIFSDMETATLIAYLIVILAVLLPALASIAADKRRLRKGPTWIGLAGIGAAVHPFFVNGELKLVDLLPALIGSLLVASVPPTRPAECQSLHLAGTLRQLVICLFLLLAFSGTALAIERERLRMDGYGMFFEYELRPGSIKQGFFKGLHTGSSFRQLFGQLDEVLQRAPNASVFFGPRLGWAYAAFNKPSPLNQPIAWDPGLMFSAEDGGMFLKSLFKQRYGLVILNKNDRAYYPLDLIEACARDYICDQSYSRLTIGYRKSRLPVEPYLVTNDAENYEKWLDSAPLSPQHFLIALNGLAWVRATCPKADQRDSTQAVLLAERACKLTQYKRSAFVATLGAAYAEAGRFEDAVTMEAKARDLALAAGDKTSAAQCKELLQLFKANKPYRQKPVPNLKNF
ncbi:MAG: hypothetical protein C5B50_08625 [Verrucomicrobia bacterium]|nr:MAG: hypothetical protein C5B50_08625 [Verrucomicrobiota bacterium]